MADIFQRAKNYFGAAGTASLATVATGEKHVIKTLRVVNYAAVARKVTIAGGAAGSLGNGDFIVRNRSLDAAPAAGETGGSLLFSEEEIEVLAPGESLVVTVDGADVAVQCHYLRRTTEP